jgi:hypothetical protein
LEFETGINSSLTMNLNESTAVAINRKVAVDLHIYDAIEAKIKAQAGICLLARWQREARRRSQVQKSKP